MNLSCLLTLIKQVPAYNQLVEQLSVGEGKHKAVLPDVAKPYLVAALYEQLDLPLMVISSQPEDARKLYEQLQLWCSPSANLHHFPELDFLPYEYGTPSANSILERLRTLATLALYQKGDKPPLIVTSALATISRTIPREDFISACHTLEQGMTVNPLELLPQWQSMGYEMEDLVEVPGTMSKRGGIIDIFPPSSQLPVRIEFFGNQVESMRLFDPENQCSSKPISSVSIIPAKELAIHKQRQTINALNLDSCTTEVRHRFQEDIARLEQRQWFPGTEFYFPLFNTQGILAYLRGNALLILDNFAEIKAAIERLHKQAQELRRLKLENGELPQGFPSPYLTWNELEAKIRTKQRLALESWNAVDTGEQRLPFASSQSYGGRLETFLKTVKQMLEQKQRVLVVTHQAKRLAELLQEEGIYTSPVSHIEQIPPRGSATIVQGSLAGGWEIKDALKLITDVELFGFVKQARPGKKVPIRRQWLLPQLTPGDYVVHIDHGIARFNGLTRMFTNGNEREYLVLEYAGNDRLYVPSEQIERISRYIGATDQPPPLNRLGTQEWERTKKRIRQSVADIAQELLGLYATREITQGFAFSTDTLWQQELESSFPYMETPDQLEAIISVKEDMEKLKPMDRLICGDVGYGKTEVALRAAFKTVMDNKQVAILVPTTVLAQQHFATFSERLQAFPLKVEMLSRFCSGQKEQEIIEGLAKGTIDICIGTHRLLQKDIAFKDLGLVIIDEEQQFGVVQKERLKQMRKEVDTLTLSATPIPRTLHMSLTGIRDMNTMETPPEERLSINSYVGAYDDTLLRQVILRELERNGQVFFVHNRVQSIVLAASKLQALIPEARIAIAHGQMPEEELERVMTDFIAGKSDILVATTIIQLGLDMPNVNTLLVNQADKFGLTQLYQLRGRTGRGAKQAYAYFLFDKGKELSPQARKRLRTISEATELGAGFGIAMKDLEIRGAGNLLGVKQSGHIADIGFDLYCQLLVQTVEELKATQAGEAERRFIPGEVKQPPGIALPLTAYIPEEYIPSLNTRLSLYHKLAKAEGIEEIQTIAQELKDRFGALPQPMRNLLYIVKAKVLATKAEVDSISTQGGQIIIKCKGDVIASETKESLRQHYDRAIKIGTTQMKLDTKHPRIKWTEALEEILRSMAKEAA